MVGLAPKRACQSISAARRLPTPTSVRNYNNRLVCEKNAGELLPGLTANVHSCRWTTGPTWRYITPGPSTDLHICRIIFRRLVPAVGSQQTSIAVFLRWSC